MDIDITWCHDDHPDLPLQTVVNSSVKDAVARLIQALQECFSVTSIGHRLVHGGPSFMAPILITPSLIDELRNLVRFDRLHMTGAVDLINTLAESLPAMPQVACFDTMFYHDMPELAQIIALPSEYRDLGIRRYGFHGLSYTFVQRAFERFAGTTAKDGRVVYAHLGSGSSMAATRHGAVVDTTMGFSSASGIPSSSRSGDIDPTIPGFIEQMGHATAAEFSEAAQTSSGLLALSETTSDMKRLLTLEATDGKAALAVSYYVYRASMAIGGLTTAIGGLDSLVFTGGIGAQSAILRKRICDRLDHLGVRLSDHLNEQHALTISDEISKVGVHVIPTDEAVVIAEQVRETVRHKEDS